MNKDTKKLLGRDEISEISTLVAGDFSLQEVLDKLAKTAVRITGVKACSIRLLDDSAGDLKMRSTYGLSEEYRNKGVVSKEDPVITAAFAGKAVIIDDMATDERVGFKEATAKEGLVSQLTVAMQFRDKAIGVLRLYSPIPKHFSEDDIALARAIASQCAVAITNARFYAEAIEGARIAEQVRLAGLIQRRMVPEKAPDIPGLDISAIYIPCFDIGGDLYDFIKISDSRLIIAIADVIGKGIPAAIMMSMFRGAMRAYTDSQSGLDNIKNIIERLNRLACGECSNGEFITLFYAILDVEKGTITYCNCGHEPTLLIRKGKIIELDKGGLVLGVEAQPEYEIETVNLANGDSLLFYTDGLIDATNFEDDLWGIDRMLEPAIKFSGNPPGQMIKNILAYRRRFVGLARQIDDTSIIVARINKTGASKSGK